MSKSVLDTGIHLKTMLPKEDIMEICRLTGELLQCRDLLRELVEKTKPRDFGLTFCACRVCGNRWEIGKSEYHSETCAWKQAEELLGPANGAGDE